MRADGKAVNKSAAVSCSSASTAMSVATHNAEAFSPDDIICLCDDGGDYKTSITAPSSGTNRHPITYKNADGDTPVIDLSVDVGGSSGWTDMGGGVFRKKGYGRVLWEDDVPLKAATSESCSDGNWYYPIGSGFLYYKPTSGTPSGHSIRTMWFEAGWAPYGLDLRNRSHITVYGLTFDRCGGGIGHGQNLSSPMSSITNITLHNNTIRRCMWAIWSQVSGNGVESDVCIYDNVIDYCNSGISAWTNSDKIPGHKQYHTRYFISGNKIMHLYSITDTKIWSDVLLSSHYYTDHEGISFQDVQDSVIANNTISATFDKAFISDQYWTRAVYFYLTNGDTPTSGNSVLRNHIYGHYYPAIYISTADGHAGFQNNTIAYNVMHYDGSYAEHISFSTRSTSDNPLTAANYFVNNTIYNPIEGMAIYASFRKDGNWVVRNNIISSPGKVTLSSDNDSGGFTFDHNIYSNATGFQTGVNGMNFDSWKNTRKYETVGSRVADPLFVSPGKDFHLQSDSPAVKAGVPAGLLEDHAGARISGTPNIGAYESQIAVRAPKAPVCPISDRP
ncbi:MAG: hypothetical protein C4581_00050 [Nitrospiraceae bacterium]|nr:MAG: hypothetical protein C4581_00050 [Nitrospiraceae bacterium]